MKRIAIMASLVFALFNANAQTEQGDALVGGSLSLNTGDDNTQFSLAPTFGYFFAKNFAAGAVLDLTTSKIGSAKTNSFSFGPFARYYFDLKQDNLKPFGHAQLGYGTTKVKTGSSSRTEHQTNLLAAVGLAYFVTPNVALEGLLGYNRSKVKNEDASSGLGFRIGFQIHLTGDNVRSAR